MWTWLIDFIYGISVGVEFVPDEEDNTYAWIIDFFFIRLVYLKL